MNLHSNRAGSGSHEPELLQVAVSVPTSEKPGSHWKVMTELSVWLVNNIPLSGGVGRTQVTKGTRNGGCIHQLQSLGLTVMFCICSRSQNAASPSKIPVVLLPSPVQVLVLLPIRATALKA